MAAEKSTQNTKAWNINIVYILTYLISFVSGVIVFIMADSMAEQKSRIKFHALQAIILGVIAVVLSFIIPFVGGLISLLIWLYGIYIGYEASTGKDIEVPAIGKWAMEHSK